MQGFRDKALAVQRYLHEHLKTALYPVPCSHGYPAGGVADEQAWVHGGADTSVVQVLSGGKHRQEDGQVEVRFSVIQTATEYGWLPARERCGQLTAELEDLLVADPTLGGLVDNAWVSRVRWVEAIPGETKTQAAGVFTVSYSAPSVAG